MSKAPESRTPSSEPKYLSLAKKIAEDIANKTYPVGSLLPTETELMERFSVSRQTVRSALAVLRDWHFVTTRRGSGSVVSSQGGSEKFENVFGSFMELTQLPAEARIKVLNRQKTIVDKTVAELINRSAGQELWHISYLRSLDQESPTSWTDIYMPLELEAFADIWGDMSSSVAVSLIESSYGERVGLVDQWISADSLDKKRAEALNVEPGSAALRIVRKYTGTHGRLLYSAVNYFPQDRFTHHAQYRRIQD